MHIFAQTLAAAQIAVVRVDRGCRVMIVAGPEVHIANEFAFFAAYHESHLRVCLEANESINHVGARLLQAIGQRDISGFVKSRHEFNNDSHFFSGSCGRYKMANNR